MDKKSTTNTSRKKNFDELQKKIAGQRSVLKEHTGKLQQNMARKIALENLLRKESSASRNKDTMRLHAEELNSINTGITAVKQKIKGAQDSLRDMLDQLLVETDPAKQVELMDDQYPVLLLPVRAETKFMVIKHIARIKRTDLPTGAVSGNTTVVNGKKLEQPVSYGVKQIYPALTTLPVVEDLNELWVRIFPDDIAIHTHEEELTELEITAGKTCWTLIWYAGKNASLELSAWRGLVNGRTPERAAWIMRVMKPLNQANAPAEPVNPADPLPVDPQFPSPPQKAASWSQMPHCRVLPDRFVVRLYNGSAYREVAGKPVPHPLPVSIDPQDDGTDAGNSNGKLVLPENLRWLQDFDEAEKIGMAIRVPLSIAEKVKGFDKMLVLGIKTSADKDEAQAMVEDLVDNHHYTPGGISIVAQGTPTNNTEDSLSGYTASNFDDEQLFHIELGDAQFNAATDDNKKEDGQRLAEALGIKFEVIEHIRNAGLTDISEAMCMNTALWPATLGYYLQQIMHPLFSDATIDSTKTHFQQYVLGRGRVPAIRVDKQPYGILPVTAFSKLTYTQTTGKAVFLNSLLKNVLLHMDTTWNELSQQVKHADQQFAASVTDKAFLDILGLHPSSVEYYQRYVTGPYFLWNLFIYNLAIDHVTTVPSNVTYATILDFMTLFDDLDYLFAAKPRVFDFIYAFKEKYLNGPVIDPFPFSETRTLNAIGSNLENYIDWLYKSDYSTIDKEDFTNIGATGAIPPNSLLYLMLRHSCLLEYVQTGIKILQNKGLLSPDAMLDLELTNIGNSKKISLEVVNLVKAKIAFKEGAALNKELRAKADDAFLKKANEGLLAGMSFKDVDASKSAYLKELREAATPGHLKNIDTLAEKELNNILFTSSKTGAITSKYDFIGTAKDLAQFIDTELKKPVIDNTLLNMAQLQAALLCLKGLPTARLERLFSEHIDLTSYRLDAWFFSLAAERLESLRNAGTKRQTGVYLGAYSWLENVKPGSFPGIAYREVTIQQTGIVIPGITEVEVTGFPFPVSITGGPVKPFAGPEPTSNAIIKNKSANLDTKAVPVSVAKGDITAALTMMESGAIKMTLDTVKENAIVGFPELVDVANLVNAGPAYTYLGSSGAGNITYDTITDKFISGPGIDPGNQGYIHAPSVNHASTAALLRAGYESHKINPASNDNAFAVNLTSQRVRRAMSYLEGMRNGQELAALLGYQFERGLHDLDLNLDQYIRDIRLKYPFVAARVTTSTGAADINEAEAYNVVDGLKLMETYRDDPAHWGSGIVFSPATDQNIIAVEINNMLDSMDAIHDLLLSESIHQAVQGNSARSNAAFNAIAGHAVPPEPQVIKTPRNFHAVTHRVGVIFDASTGGEKTWTISGTVRSLAVPKLNRWLGAQLPAEEKIVINCSYTENNSNGSPGQTTDFSITPGELFIEPVDLVYLMDISLEDDIESNLYELIRYHVRATIAQSDDVVVTIKNADRTGLDIDEISLAELKPLATSLLKIIQDGKSLDGKDFLTGTDAIDVINAHPAAGLHTAGLLARLQDAAGTTMLNAQNGLSGLITELSQAVADLAPNIPAFPGTFNPAQYSRLRAAMLYSNYFGIPQSIPATAIRYDLEDGRDLLSRAQQAIILLNARKKAADPLLASVAAQATETAKLNILLKAGEAIFGRAFNVYPDFNFYLPAAITAARSYSGYLDTAGVHAIEEWIQGLSPVRKRMHNFQQLRLLTDSLCGEAAVPPLRVIQFPLAPVDATGNIQTQWVGMQLPEGYDVPNDNVSLVFSYPAAFDVNVIQSGMIIDEWVEEIPLPVAKTGLAVHYNNPNAETPNACLLAVSPNLNGTWAWNDLMDTLNETLQWAKKRAVDPDLLNKTPYAQLLPAVMAAVSGSGDTPALDFGRNSISNPKPSRPDLIKLEDYTLTLKV